MLMWACDVVPGVSGGTIAVITWIYERLIQAIKNIVPNLKNFFTLKRKTFWQNIDGTIMFDCMNWNQFSIACKYNYWCDEELPYFNMVILFLINTYLFHTFMKTN